MSMPPSLPEILDPSHPLAYLAYLPPSLAYELTVAVSILIAAASVQIWDIFNNLYEDSKLLLKRPFAFHGVVYCVSRISTLAYLLHGIIYETAPIWHCKKLSKVSPWLFCFAMPSTALLFYFRVCAMYDHNKYVSGFFFLLWLCVLGGSVASVIGVTGYNIGPTAHCLSGSLKPFVSMSAIVQLVNDSLTLVAISVRLMQIAKTEDTGLKDMLKTVCFAKDLPALSRSLLRDGQVYYLFATCSALMVLITFYIESIPLAYRLSFGVANLPIINIMACRVYRRTKSGKYRENSAANLILPLSFLRESRIGNDNITGMVKSRIQERRSSVILVTPISSTRESDRPPKGWNISAQEELSGELVRKSAAL